MAERPAGPDGGDVEVRPTGLSLETERARRPIASSTLMASSTRGMVDFGTPSSKDIQIAQVLRNENVGFTFFGQSNVLNMTKARAKRLFHDSQPLPIPEEAATKGGRGSGRGRKGSLESTNSLTTGLLSLE